MRELRSAVSPRSTTVVAHSEFMPEKSHLNGEMAASLDRLRKISDERQADLQLQQHIASQSDDAAQHRVETPDSHDDAPDSHDDAMVRRAETADRRDETQEQRESMLNDRQAALDQREQRLDRRESKD